MRLDQYLPTHVAKPVYPVTNAYFPKDGETIWHVAYKMTGNPLRWVEICLYNNIKDPLNLPSEIKFPTGA